MTTGEFQTFPVAEIWVDRAKRQRKELNGIEDLAESIARVGLIHPPVIRRDGELIVGERRWTAIKSLGWTHLPVQFIEDLPPEELRKVELEENVRRVDISWQDRCLAVAEYNSLRKAEDPTWTLDKTAENLGLSQPRVSALIQVAEEIKAGNTKVAEAPKLSTASGIVARKIERRRASTLAKIEGKPAPESLPAPILHADFHEWQKTYSGDKFNFIHCDFPYGVNADKQQQGTAVAAWGGYADGLDVYQALLITLKAAMENVIAESAHLMFWFSMDYYEMTRLALEDMGWKVDPFPLIWHKSDNTGMLPDAKRGPRRIYETCFFASRNDRLITRATSNVASEPVVKTAHMSQKNETMLRRFMGMFVDEYSRVLDPTCGSGSALKAATACGANFVMGLEANEEFYNAAVEGYYDD